MGLVITFRGRIFNSLIFLDEFLFIFIIHKIPTILFKVYKIFTNKKINIFGDDLCINSPIVKEEDHCLVLMENYEELMSYYKTRI